MAQGSVKTTVEIDLFNKDFKMLTEGAAMISFTTLFHGWIQTVLMGMVGHLTTGSQCSPFRSEDT